MLLTEFNVVSSASPINSLFKMPPKADINKAGWEQSEFPILCETCASFHPHLTTRLTKRKGLGDNPFIRMVSTLFLSRCGRSLTDNPNKKKSQSKSLDANAGPARDRSPSSAGTREQACASRRPWSVRRVPRLATYARRAYSTSNITYPRKCAIPRSASRTRLRRAKSTGNITRRIRKPRCASRKGAVVIY